MMEPTDFFESQYWSKQRKPEMKTAQGLSAELLTVSQEWESGGKSNELVGGISKCSTIFYYNPTMMWIGNTLQWDQLRCIILSPLSYCVQGEGTAIGLR